MKLEQARKIAAGAERRGLPWCQSFRDTLLTVEEVEKEGKWPKGAPKKPGHRYLIAGSPMNPNRTVVELPERARFEVIDEAVSIVEEHMASEVKKRTGLSVFALLNMFKR